MTISTSFKTPCPTCDAIVTIKDPKLIGKKVECPRCKARFVVEDPSARDKKEVQDEGVKTAAPKPAPPRPREAVTSKPPAKPARKEAIGADTPKPANKLAKAPPPPADDDEEDDEEVAPKAKAKVNGKAVKAPPPPVDDEDEEEEEAPKAKAPAKPGKAPARPAHDEEEDAEAPGAKTEDDEDADAKTDEDEDAKDQDDKAAGKKGKDKGKKKKKKGGKGKESPLLIFVKEKKIPILAGVGVVVLVVAGIFLIKSMTKKDPPKKNTPVVQHNPKQDQPDPGAGDKADKKDNDQGDKDKDKPAPAEVKGAGAELTNLLPRSTQGVFQLNFKDFRESPLGAAALGPRGAFSDDAIKDRLGFSLQEVDNLIVAEHYGDHWSFTVLHTMQPIDDLAPLKTAFGLKAVPPIKEQEFYQITQNPHWLTNLARLSLGAPMHAHVPQSGAGASPLFLRLHDRQTLIVAHSAPMRKFLEDEGYPGAYGSKTSGKPAGKPPSPGGSDDKSPGSGGPGGKFPGPGGKFPGPGGDGKFPGPGGDGKFPGPGGDGKFPGPGGDGKFPGPGGDGKFPRPGGDGKFPRPGGDGKFPGPGGWPQQNLVETWSTIHPSLKRMLDRMARTRSDSEDRMIFLSATDLGKVRRGTRSADSRSRVFGFIRPMWDLTGGLNDKTDQINLLGTTLQYIKDGPSYVYKNAMECNSDLEAEALKADLKGKVAPELIKLFQQLLSHKVDLAKNDADGRTPGGFKPGEFPPGGFKPGEVPPNFKPGEFPPNFKPGNFPPGGFKPGDRPGQGEKQEDVKKSRILVGQNSTDVTFRLDLVLDERAARRLNDLFQVVEIGLRAEMDAAEGGPRFHELALAGRKLGEGGVSKRDIAPGRYPPGAFPRKGATRSARDPGQRVSWMAGLLPYLGRGGLFDQISFDKSWKHPANWLAARTGVPEFLDPTYPRDSRYAPYPGLPLDAAATHFVGLAGIGPDAAEYPADDPLLANKLGVFGYDRGATLDEIRAGRGGLSNTILLIRVPHDGPAGVTPWMAGGGSTVRTVPEKDSVEPFLSTESDGSRGTYVLMTDGSVRYIKKGISDDAFKALATVRGGSPFDLDKVAPAVPPPGQAKPPAPKEGGKKANPPAKDGEAPQKDPAKEEAKAPVIPPGWKQFTSKEERFTILLPGVPVEQELVVKTDAGSIKAKLFIVGMSGAAKCVVNCIPVPQAPPPGKEDAFFAGMKAGVLKQQPGAKIVAERKTSVGAYPGLEFEVEHPATGSVKTAAFLVGQRAYTVSVVPSGEETVANIRRVIDSFRPLKD